MKVRLLFIVLIAFLVPVLAQNEVRDNEIRFELRTDKASVAPDDRLAAIVVADVQQGWHLYSTTQAAGGPVTTTINLDASPVFKQAGELVSPPPRKSFDENFGIETETYEGRVEFRLPVQVAADAPTGNQNLSIKVRYMLCSDTLCLPPQTKTLAIEVSVTGGSTAAAQPVGPTSKSDIRVPLGSGTYEEPQGPQRQQGKGGDASATPGAPAGAGDSAPRSDEGAAAPGNSQSGPLGTMAYIWFSMAMGGLALLTPCVFPMIPITVSYFTKRQAVSRKQAIGEAFLYSVGIVLTFTLIGFGLTFAFGAGGINRLAASPVVNALIALVFIVFALSLFGALEIRLPSSWLTAVDRQSSRIGGLVGILLMALTFSLTSFTCTVPFVGTVMVAALQGDWLWSLLGVTVFAAVFSAPFFILAVFPSVLKSLPKSGNWMNSVKIIMGFLEIAAALKFISNVDLVYQAEFLTRPVFITVWLAIALAAAIYLLGWFRLPHEVPTEALGVFRLFSAIFFLAVSFYLLRGLMGFPLGELDAFLPPRDYGEVSAAGLDPAGNRTVQSGEEKWLTNYAAALEVARQERRPVFIDFTGYTCTNCRWMESNVFPLPEVQELFGRYVLVRLYTDGPDREHEENLNFERDRFGTIALPFYAVVSPDRATIATFPGLTRNPGQFVSFLKKGLGDIS